MPSKTARQVLTDELLQEFLIRRGLEQMEWLDDQLLKELDSDSDADSELDSDHDVELDDDELFDLLFDPPTIPTSILSFLFCPPLILDAFECILCPKSQSRSSCEISSFPGEPSGRLIARQTLTV